MQQPASPVNPELFMEEPSDDEDEPGTARSAVPGRRVPPGQRQPPAQPVKEQDPLPGVDPPLDPSAVDQVVPGDPGSLDTAYTEQLNLKQSRSGVTVDPDEHRRGSILLEIARAGEKVEAIIEQYADEIDAEMLEMLERRISLARMDPHESVAVDGLTLLYRRHAGLRAEYERQRASPGLRLLDEVMRLLTPDDGDERRGQREREAAATARLASAFSTGAGPGSDLLDLARRLAKSGESAADYLADSLVDRAAFVAEAREVLQVAAAGQAELEDALAAAQATAQGTEASVAQRARLAEAHAERKTAMARIHKAIQLAQRGS